MVYVVRYSSSEWMMVEAAALDDERGTASGEQNRHNQIDMIPSAIKIHILDLLSCFITINIIGAMA